jgi:hypothetical protein
MGRLWNRLKDDIELYRVEVANARTAKPEHKVVLADNRRREAAARKAKQRAKRGS